MSRPPTFSEADERGLITRDKGRDVLTFSNGTSWDYWADSNCYECWFWDKEAAGAGCAFECAAMLHMVSPELARLFGWTRKDDEAAAYYKAEGKPDDIRQFWSEPETCAFFKQRPEKGDDGEDVPLPPDPDPDQLVLLADPTEDLAQFPTSLPEPRRVAVPA